MKVVRCESKDVRSWFERKHYLKRRPKSIQCYALLDGDNCIGALSYTKPPSPHLCRSICGHEWAAEVWELARLVIDAPHRRNLASHFMAQTFKQLPTPRILVSFADTGRGHVGTIYQAANWIYTGISKGYSSKSFVVDGKVLHNRARSKRSESREEMARIETTDKHRYIKLLGDKSDVKLMRRCLQLEPLPYPKTVSNPPLQS